MKTDHRSSRELGFTRTDLMAASTSIVLLCLLAMTAGAGTRTTSDAVRCRANLGHLIKAWQSHSLDHEERYIGTTTATLTSGTEEFWCVGVISWDTSLDNTNINYVQVPAFVPYVGRNPRVFKCPGDRWISNQQVARGMHSRIRSYSMNQVFGPPLSVFDPRARQFERASDVPDPSQYFVLLEEHPDSINDPSFVVPQTGVTQWFDLPASTHEGSCGFAFADGHIELKQWKNSRTVVPVRFQFSTILTAGNDVDRIWATEHGSIRGQ